MNTKRKIRCLLWVIVSAMFATSAPASFHETYIVYFPQVVRGVLTDYYETTIVISSAASEVTDVTLTSDLLPQSTLQLKAGETVRVRVSGTDFRMGHVRVEASHTVAAAAHIVTKPTPSSDVILAEVTILAERPTSKAVIPVFRKVPGSTEEILAENTGIAIVINRSAYILLTLRDAQGTVVTTRRLVPGEFPGHIAKFVTEFFPGLSPTFELGSLTLEEAEGSFIPQAFAVTALYMQGNKMWSSAVTPVDIPVTWEVKLKSADSPQQKAQEMANQYGFTISSFSFGDPRTFFLLTTEEIARAVARDSRVEYVRANRLIPLAAVADR